MTPIFALYPPQPWYRGPVELAIVAACVLAIILVCKRSRKTSPLWGRCGAMLNLIAIAIGGVIAAGGWFCFATMPKWDLPSAYFWDLWEDNVRWDWWTQKQVAFSLLCAPTGMLAAALLVELLARILRRTPAKDNSPAL